MARWRSSLLAGSLSIDGVTIKILVVIQPYIYQPFLWGVKNKWISSRRTWAASGKCDGAQVPRARSFAGNYFWCWVIKVAKNNCYHLFYKKNKNKDIKQPWEKVGEMRIHECIGMFIKVIENRDQNRDWENSAWFVDREENVGNWWRKIKWTK